MGEKGVSSIIVVIAIVIVIAVFGCSAYILVIRRVVHLASPKIETTVVDNNGTPEIKVNFAGENKDCGLRLFNPDEVLISSANITSDELLIGSTTKWLSLGSPYVTPRSGTYTLTIVDAKGEKFYEKKLIYRGASLRVNRYLPEIFDDGQSLHVWRFWMELKNEGDVPVYVTTGEIMDNLRGVYVGNIGSFHLGKLSLLPGEINYVAIEGSSVVYPENIGIIPIIGVTLYDDAGNVVLPTKSYEYNYKTGGWGIP